MKKTTVSTKPALKKIIPSLKKAIFPLIITGMSTVILLLARFPLDGEWIGFKSKIENQPSPTTIKLVDGTKTLWDWLGLVLAPATLTILGFWFQASLEQARAGREQIEQEKEEEAKVRAGERAENEQREGALAAYLGSMSDLLVGQRLSALAKKQAKGLLSEDEQFLLNAGMDVIRARTLSILRRLTDTKDPKLTDGARKASVLLFLYESELIQSQELATVDNQETSLAEKPLLNLKEADLTDTQLSNTNLSHADLSGANLTRANLSPANLSHARLSCAHLHSADLSHANLSHVDLSGAHLNHIRLSGADLSTANLASAYLNHADLHSADLINAHLNNAHLLGADLSHADLSDAHLNDAHLNDAHLISANLSDADLTGAHLSRADISSARLSGAHLSRADLSGARLSGAHLSSADLSDADLSRTDLSRVDLSRAHLNGANLSHANLSHADLSCADLSGAYLSQTNLNGVHLRDTNLSGALLFVLDLSRTEELTEQQFKREEIENSPLLCDVDLPAGVSVNRNRDCDRLPEVLYNRYPERFKTLEEAREFVKKRRNKWDKKG